MPDQILAVGPNGRKRMIPPRWLDIPSLGFRRPPSAKKKQKRPAPPPETNTAAEPTAETEPKEEPNGSNAG